VKHLVALAVSLMVVWLLWSGHYDAFLLTLGGMSVAFVVALCWRMGIVDGESVPLGLRYGRWSFYLVWLAKEIVVANLDVTRRILKREMPIRPRMIELISHQQTDLGRVIYANSITLTPGTVAVDVQEDRIRVHALSAGEADDELSSDMNDRVTRMER
jgi:multicomponent Na+:H+ antiporter subunit E